jgi:hypothetical protein
MPVRHWELMAAVESRPSPCAQLLAQPPVVGTIRSYLPSAVPVAPGYVAVYSITNQFPSAQSCPGGSGSAAAEPVPKAVMHAVTSTAISGRRRLTDPPSSVQRTQPAWRA